MKETSCLNCKYDCDKKRELTNVIYGEHPEILSTISEILYKSFARNCKNYEVIK